MHRGSPDILHHQKSFRIKHDDDKFLSKLLSKDAAKRNPSFRVYYGDVSSAVPFTWETRPGTPKHVSSENSHIPPLTPPPSYYTNKLTNSSSKTSRSKLIFHNLLRRMNPKKYQFAAPNSRSSSSLSWSSSSQSSFSDPLSTPAYVRKRRRFSSWGSSVSNFDDRAAAAMDDRRASKTCFGIGNGGGYSAVVVKKALLSIVGRGSAS
ncbi:hypothetical protein ACS0TY_015358 [Phlomoides rotata]